MEERAVDAAAQIEQQREVERHLLGGERRRAPAATPLSVSSKSAAVSPGTARLLLRTDTVMVMPSTPERNTSWPAGRGDARSRRRDDRAGVYALGFNRLRTRSMRGYQKRQSAA